VAKVNSDTKTVRLRCIKSVFSKEIVREDLPAYITTDRFTSPHQVYELFRDLIQETKEYFIALHLDGKNRIICFDRISVGSLNQSIVHPREVFKGAILSSAAALILIHNHPTGDPSPSAEDRAITKRLVEVGDLVGIRVLDHIIIGNGEFLSFTERGLL
jgi:DNA repair protein RadC